MKAAWMVYFAFLIKCKVGYPANPPVILELRLKNSATEVKTGVHALLPHQRESTKHYRWPGTLLGSCKMKFIMLRIKHLTGKRNSCYNLFPGESP